MMSLLRLPATPEPPPETELSLLRVDTPEPSPEPNSTPAASPNEQSAELDSSVPDIQEPCLTSLPSSPAPAPAPSPPAPAPPCCPAPARAPHPASFYALPYCPCSAGYKPQPPARPVPVSLPVVRHYAPGYFRPRVSPQQYYSQFRPPVSLDYYVPNLAGQPIFHQNPQNFPAVQHPQNCMPNSTYNPQQFVPNSTHNPQQFVPNSTHNPQQFVPNSMQNHQQFVPHPAPQNFTPVPPTNFVSNSVQAPPNFGPSPMHNSPNFEPSPIPGSPHFGTSPMPGPQNFRPSPVPNTQSVAPNTTPQPASPAPNGPQLLNGSGSLLASRLSPGGDDGPSVRLSAEECEIFELLSRVEPGAAHRYMMAALRRARAAGPGPDAEVARSGLNPEAAEFRAEPTNVRPPPGFENMIK